MSAENVAAPAPKADVAEEGTEQPPVVKDEKEVRQAGGVEARRLAMRKYFDQQLKTARQAYDKGDYDRCVAICRNVMNADPRHVDAVKLLTKAHAKQADADEAVTRAASARKDRDGLLEAEEHAVRPPVRTPEVRPEWPRRQDDPGIPRRQKMAELLEQRVSVDFMKADLDWVFNTFYVLTGINIVADPAAIEGKTLTLHVQDLPLREVLNFIVRNNDGIQYSITEDALWITATSASDLKKIMIPRIYPIHHGLVSTKAVSGGSSGQRSANTGRANSGQGPVGQQQNQQAQQGQANLKPSYLETVLEWLKKQKDPQTFPDGSDYQIDLPSNQLIVFTTPAGHAKLAEFLEILDQPPIQVLIKARFLDVSLEANKALGIDLNALNTKIGANDVALSLVGGTPANLPGTLGTGTLFTVTGSRTDPLFQVTLNALLNNRNTKILSEPQILALNNKEAFIDITTQFSYIRDLRPITGTQFGGSGTATTNVIAFVPEFDTENIGFTLDVIPSVGRDLKTINLHIRPLIDSLAQGQNISQFQTFTPGQTVNGALVPPVIQRPTIDQTSLETDVVLEDNGFVIIGGLIRNRQEIFERKFPGLHRIPFLGQLFKSKSQNKTTSNLIIIVEAQIITPRGRTYRTDPNADDGDIREGGSNRAPGQVSEVQRPEAVNRALGLNVPRARSSSAALMAGSGLPGSPALQNPAQAERKQPLHLQDPTGMRPGKSVTTLASPAAAQPPGSSGSEREWALPEER